MKILVLSDSHSGLSFMRMAIRKLSPDAVVHLGDYYDDGEAMQEEFPNIRFSLVPGNCDRGYLLRPVPETVCYPVCGVMLYMTHGHVHHVKEGGLYSLLEDARRIGAQAALFGHTHDSFCERTDDGLWVLNPGSCRSFGGSVGLIETQDGKIHKCRVLGVSELEGIL